MTRRRWVPEDTDQDVPNVARVYDCYLGGSHNFAADRDLAREAVEMWPDLPLIMRENRAFLRRAVQFLAGEGITRFLDIGSGLPTFGPVHEVARVVQPEARVVYVDIDPVAVQHSRLLVADDPLCAVVEADMRDPAQLLARPAVAELLRPREPVAALLLAVLHFVTDEEDPARIVRELSAALPTGSALALSHGAREGRPDLVEKHEDLYARASAPLTMRTREQIVALFEGFRLLEPGVVYLPEWRPQDPASVGPHPELLSGLAGVGLKP
ncbi:SAM-dependent methyltransferase [Streptomyces endophytica]|uniref:SAM-dependent methyltransferase n=1 Tax=Streptomyces endophytica TaxID=2991496 RepID=A0ABY6PFU7_9ACTN|nr:SAM-dependent methyltransferase [Streptomyces endophytica]UZJ32659.1 SAM-dependent methyltransferase [Streptomyces endophytica]